MLTCGGGNKLILDLILALQPLTVARTLPSRISDRTLFTDLAMLSIRVNSNQFEVKLAVQLVEQVVNHASDTDIWSAVFSLVAHTIPKPMTPPTVFHKDISTHRSSPLHPHCRAANRFTIYWTNALSKRSMAAFMRTQTASMEKYFE